MTMPVALGSADDRAFVLRCPDQARAVRVGWVLLFLGILALPRFALNSGGLVANPSLIAMYVLGLLLLVTGRLVVSASRLLLVVACLGVASVSYYVNVLESASPRSSLGSLALLAVMYAPFAFTVKDGSLRLPKHALRADGDGGDLRYATEAFLALTFALGVLGIAQFYAQFFFRPAWLFDFSERIPPFLRASSHFNTVIPVGSYFKANGFLLREPSAFSFLMGLALLLEFHGNQRPLRLAVLGLGLLLSYSGTGILALAIGALFPLRAKTVVRVGALVAVGALVVWLLGDALNLGFTLGRVTEFGADRQHSSGHIRYIAPARLVADTFFRHPWSPWLGHGPGSISRETQVYEFFDPTWAKLIFEYGIVGFLLFLLLFRAVMRGSGLPASVREVLFFSWLVMGGHLLSPDANYLALGLAGLLPRTSRAYAPRLGPEVTVREPVFDLVRRPASAEVRGGAGGLDI